MFEVRLAQEHDTQAMLEIYAPVIENTITSFEYLVPSVNQFRERVRSTMEMYPWLVCTDDNMLTAYAYAGPHRTRHAYQWSVELSVYVHQEYHRRGIAKALYTALMAILKIQGFYTALAGISLPNQVSIKFHEALGFTAVGTYHNVGYKFGRWHDTGWWQRPLQPYQLNADKPLPLKEIIQLGELEEILYSAANVLALRNDEK